MATACYYCLMDLARPWTALCITFGVAAAVNLYGLLDTALMLVCLIAGIIIYKMISY